MPTEDEIVEYAKWLGMDLEKDKDLLWVAKEGLMAPLARNGMPCKSRRTSDVHNDHLATSKSASDPYSRDIDFKRRFEEAKKKKEMNNQLNALLAAEKEGAWRLRLFSVVEIDLCSYFELID